MVARWFKALLIEVGPVLLCACSSSPGANGVPSGDEAPVQGDAIGDGMGDAQIGTCEDPAIPGPHPVGRITIEVSSPSSGKSIDADVCFPGTGQTVIPSQSPYPVGIILHGFLSNKNAHRGQAELLASFGFVVMVPTMPFGLTDNSSERKEIFLDLLDALPDAHADPTSPFFEADLSRIGLAGYSAGGLTALMVTSSDDRIGALVGLDAVICGGAPGSTTVYWDPSVAGPAIDVPSALLVAPPQSLNADNCDGLLIYDHLGSPTKARYGIVGASHCDFMDYNAACYLMAGTHDPERTALINRYLVAWLRLFIKGEPACATYLFGAQSDADVDAGRITREFQGAP